MSDEQPINREEAAKKVSALLERRIVAPIDKFIPTNKAKAGNATGFIANTDDNTTYMVKESLKPKELAEFQRMFNDFFNAISTLPRNIQQLSLDTMVAGAKSIKDAAKEQDLNNKLQEALTLYLYNTISPMPEELEQSSKTFEELSSYLKQTSQQFIDKGFNAAGSPDYDKDQAVAEFSIGGVLQKLLPGKASDLALVYSGNEVAIDPKTKVASITADPNTSKIYTRSEFLGPEFETMAELAKRIEKEGGNPIKAWRSVRGFSDVIAASYMIGDYDIHPGNIGVVKKAELNDAGEHIRDENGEQKYYLQAVKIDHGFAATNIAGTKSHLHPNYINMSVSPNFAEIRNDFVNHLQYGLSDKYGDSYLRVTMTPEQLKNSIDSMQNTKNIDESTAPEQIDKQMQIPLDAMIDSVGQRLYALAQIGEISKEEAEHKHQAIAQALSDRYYGMRDLSVRLGQFIDSDEYKGVSFEERMNRWLDPLTKLYSKDEGIRKDVDIALKKLGITIEYPDDLAPVIIDKYESKDGNGIDGAALFLQDMYNTIGPDRTELRQFLQQPITSSWLDVAVRYERDYELAPLSTPYPKVTVQPLFSSEEEKAEQKARIEALTPARAAASAELRQKGQTLDDSDSAIASSSVRSSPTLGSVSSNPFSPTASPASTNPFSSLTNSPASNSPNPFADVMSAKAQEVLQEAIKDARDGQQRHDRSPAKQASHGTGTPSHGTAIPGR